MPQAIVPSVPVAACTVLGEKLGALSLRIALKQVQRGRLNPLVLGQLDRSLSVSMIIEQSLEIGRTIPPSDILLLGQKSQCTGSTEKHEHDTNVERMAHLPFANERHQTNQANKHTRDINSTPNFPVPCERIQLEKLE